MPTTNFLSTDLPALQPRTHCVLIARDPNYIYAYWDYTQEDIDRLRNKLQFEAENAQLILRVFDLTGSHTWDLDVGLSVKDWYIHVWQDNTDYIVELGLRSKAGHFIPLTRSNGVRTAPVTSSQRSDLIWQEIKTHRESQPYLKEEIRQRYQRLMHVAKDKFAKLKAPRKARLYHLGPQDIRDYYLKLFNWVSRRWNKKEHAAAPHSMEEVLKRKGGAGVLSWQKVRPVVTCPELMKNLRQGASMEFLESQQGASENLSNPQQGGSEERLKQRKFFFEVWAELIVHGRTEADAQVWLNAEEIKLNPDGTFSLRYSLPDGKVPLKFIAQSSDGVEQRHINTGVEREQTKSFPKILKDPRA